MKRFVFLIITVLFCTPYILAADGDPARPPREQDQQQIERFHRAQEELRQQREQLERERQELDRHRDQMQQRFPHKQMLKERHRPICALIMVMCLVVHILVAVWVFQDIRSRGCGSGIWIVIALITGLLGALVYAVVRLGDIKKT